jgi:hypothetical protein
MLKLSFDPALCILPTTQIFNNLIYLNVNAPHATIAQFLMNHKHIISLVARTCYTYTVLL